MIVYKDIPQGSEKWLEMRNRYIGASDSPIILGVSPWSTPYKLWQHKTGKKESAPMNPAMKRGHEKEPIARALACKRIGKQFTPICAFNTEYPHLMASLDGLSDDKNYILEIKCPGEKSAKQAFDGFIPQHYMIQIQHQLLVTGVPLAYYGVWYEDDMVIMTVEPDASIFSQIKEAALEFHHLMLSNIAPPMSANDYNIRDDREWTEVAHKWRDVVTKRAELELLEDELRKCVIEMAQGQNCIGAGIRLTKSVRKGAIDYSRIPEIKGIDLDQYRKKGTEYYTLAMASV